MNSKYLLAVLAAFIIVSKEYLLLNDSLVIIAVFATVFYLIVSQFGSVITGHIRDVCIYLNNEYTSIFKKDEHNSKSFAEELRQYVLYNSSSDKYLSQLSDKIICA